MAKLIVRMSRRHNLFENLVWFFRPGNFSHAAIALEEDPKTFYTFNLKGFHIEGTKRVQDTTTVYYELVVTEEEYEAVKSGIRNVQENRESYKYAVVGVLLALIFIPIKQKNHYFCSQFVAELLMEAGVINTWQSSTTILPNDLGRLLAQASTMADGTLHEEEQNRMVRAMQRVGGALIAVMLGDNENIPDIPVAPFRGLVNRINVMLYVFRARRLVTKVVRRVLVSALADDDIDQTVEILAKEAKEISFRELGRKYLERYAAMDMMTLQISSLGWADAAGAANAAETVREIEQRMLREAGLLPPEETAPAPDETLGNEHPQTDEDGPEGPPPA